MIYLWTFLAISILAVSCYIGQVMGAFSAVSSFTGMVIPCRTDLFYSMYGCKMAMKSLADYCSFSHRHVG
ncbi:Protein of uncharacterised function (DUF2545) [Salmonella enterica subsp. diarizonae]|uniref:Protein of uncharacterized function (DUF2545) n=1 Tax=Salmonella diarizonae TaxID=59204 RepID=A0A379TWV4_SALDZ|nr:Protein of uncharacterised function (DUF2545) [Salmonella enterica subsp. diarizonae]